MAMAVLLLFSSRFLTTILGFTLAFVCHTSSPLSLAEATNSGGFSLELLHRDSPESPLYDSSETPSQRLNKSLLRSLRRVEHLSSLIKGETKSPSTTLGFDYTGEYLVKVGFGTPVIQTYLVVDTSSSLVWTQCKGCTKCFQLSAPLYNPSASSSYSPVGCGSPSCKSLKNTCSAKVCRYLVSNGDGFTHTFGALAQESLTLTSPRGDRSSLPKFVFGCGYDNQVFFLGNISGVLGLGSGMNSMATQMRSSAGPKFSYCFVPSRNVPGRLSFGEESFNAGRKVVSTPLILNTSDNLYRITLKAISVGKTKLDLGKSSKVGNMVVDSGTLQTLLPADIYAKLKGEVIKIINAPEIVPPTEEKLSRLCYLSTVRLPNVVLTMHFAGADLPLKLSDMFIKYDKGIACFTFGPSKGNLLIYGNLAQSNFWVGFDLAAKTLSFKPSDCKAP